MSAAMDNQKTAVPTRPKVTPLHGGGLDLEEVQKKLLQEFARAAQEDPVKNNLPTSEELQGDFDALIEARALQLIESRSRSGSFSLSGGGSPFSAGGGGMSSLPTSAPATTTTRSPVQSSSPPLPTDHVQRPPVHHLPSGLSMTSAVPSTSSPLTMTSSTPAHAPFVNQIHEEPHTYDPTANESAISSGVNTPNTGASLSRQTSIRSGSSRPGSRRPSMKLNVNNYEVR